MRCLTKASTTKTTKTASPLLRFRFPPEFLIQGIAHTKSHCSHNKALGCHTQVIRWTDILVFPLLFNLYNPYATIAAKPAIPMGTNGASLAFWISLDPWSSSYEEREISVSLDIVIEESSDNFKTFQVSTRFWPHSRTRRPASFQTCSFLWPSIFHCVYVPQIFYPFICRRTSRLLLCSSRCK